MGSKLTQISTCMGVKIIFNGIRSDAILVEWGGIIDGSYMLNNYKKNTNTIGLH